MVVTRRRSIIVFVAVLSRVCLVSGLAQNGKIRPERIELGDLIGSGEFGRVHWGNYCSSQKEGNAPPERIVAKSAKPGVPLAAAYLETEAYVNRRLSLESNGRKCPYIAPYIWEYTTSEGTKQLVWGVISAVHSRIYGAYARKCLGLCICTMRIVCTAKNAIDAHKKRFSCGILL